jgi:hypothetical protein
VADSDFVVSVCHTYAVGATSRALFTECAIEGTCSTLKCAMIRLPDALVCAGTMGWVIFN